MGALAVSLLAAPLATDAQERAKVPRVGYISDRSIAMEKDLLPAFLKGLRELGYIEGKNIVIERRHLPGQAEKLHELAAELVRLKVDVIVTSRSGLARDTRKLTTTIPIVFTVSDDPVGRGLVDSLARPGGNVTGLSDFHGHLLGKRLEFLKEVAPSAARFVFLYYADSSSGQHQLKELQEAARGLRVTLLSVGVKEPHDFDGAFTRIREESARGLVVHGNRLLSNNRKQIFSFTHKSRLPAIYTHDRWVAAGGLMSYGANFPDIWRRAATYVNKILRGAKPAELPVEQPMKFDLSINLKTAGQIGVTIPPAILYRADKVIQ